jgi:hypothetical protein
MTMSFLTIDDVEKTLCIEITDVTGSHVALGIEGPRRFLKVAPVAEHVGHGTQADLARLADRWRSAILADHLAPRWWRARCPLPGAEGVLRPPTSATAPVVSVMPNPVPGTARGKARVISASMPDCSAWPPVETLVSERQIVTGEFRRAQPGPTSRSGTQGNCVTFSSRSVAVPSLASHRRHEHDLAAANQRRAGRYAEPLVWKNGNISSTQVCGDMAASCSQR